MAAEVGEMATATPPRTREPSVRITEPEKESKPRPPPLDVSLAGTSAGPKTPGGSTLTPRYDRDRKIGHRRVDEDGQVTYKKKPTSELMAAMQLGIGQSITNLSTKPKRDLLLQDFSIVETVTFAREGSNLTPAHHYSDFRFKTYAPVAFRYFRELFGIQPDDFLLSLCNEPLQELSNPGASGSIFYISNDDEFIIKTVQHKEAEFLQKLLPGYYMNLNQNPRTLLPKFYGLYCYQCGGKNIRFVVMNNLLPSSIKIHEKYDLKGSTYKRKASKHERSKASPTLKDLDFMQIHQDGILLEADTHNAMQKTIERDCRVLQSFKIMDYSLLLGVHNLDLAAKEREVAALDQATGSGNSERKPPQRALSRGRSMKQKLAAYSTALESIQARSEPIELENEDVPVGGIPARNNKGERILLYMGLIDILQSYRLKKKLEHAMKAMVHDGDTISVHRPGFYAQRFMGFFADKVFRKIPSSLKHSPSKKKGITQRQRSVTTSEVEGRTNERGGALERIRTISTNDDTGATGGRPDLLPAASTPPPTFAEAIGSSELTDSHVTYTSTTTGGHVTVITTTSLSSTRSRSRSETENSHHSTGFGDNAGGMLGSPAHSVSESTPTHTEYTEGTPSFTTSSPSCSSEVLGSASKTGWDSSQLLTRPASSQHSAERGPDRAGVDHNLGISGGGDFSGGSPTSILIRAGISLQTSNQHQHRDLLQLGAGHTGRR